MKKIIYTFVLLFATGIIFTACDRDEPNPNQTDAGVVIDGIRWATRNVDAPGTFAENPEDAGMF